MESTILQYQISDWTQLTKCQSNNSPDLKIKVSKFLQNRDISGTKVQVEHPKYGVLFAYTILPKGSLITDIHAWTEDVMTRETLLNELYRYGFYVTYKAEASLTSKQVRLLKSIQGLMFDKIRVLRVYKDSDVDTASIKFVAFNIQQNEDWLNSNYSCSESEFTEAIVSGSAINLEGLAEFSNYNWDWLYNSIYDIDQLVMRYDDAE